MWTETKSIGNKFPQAIIWWTFTILIQNEKRQFYRLTPPSQFCSDNLFSLISLLCSLCDYHTQVNCKYPTVSVMTSFSWHNLHPHHYFHWYINTGQSKLDAKNWDLNNLPYLGTNSPIPPCLLVYTYPICFWWSSDCGPISVTLHELLAPLILGEVSSYFLMDTGG